MQKLNRQRWMILIIRFFLALVFVVYGVLKLFWLQLATGDLSDLRFGEASPMLVTWHFFSLSPLYHHAIGIAQIAHRPLTHRPADGGGRGVVLPGHHREYRADQFRLRHRPGCEGAELRPACPGWRSARPLPAAVSPAAASGRRARRDAQPAIQGRRPRTGTPRRNATPRGLEAMHRREAVVEVARWDYIGLSRDRPVRTCPTDSRRSSAGTVAPADHGSWSARLRLGAGTLPVPGRRRRGAVPDVVASRERPGRKQSLAWSALAEFLVAHGQEEQVEGVGLARRFGRGSSPAWPPLPRTSRCDTEPRRACSRASHRPAVTRPPAGLSRAPWPGRAAQPAQ